MKLKIAALLLFAVAVLNTQSQTTTPTSASASGWNAVTRDECSTIWQFNEFVTNTATGAVLSRPHGITEVATSLNYLDSNGQWQPSIDLIEPMSDGSAAAVHGPTRVYFNPDPTSDTALTIVTKSNRTFQVRVLGVYLCDPLTGQSTLLAFVTNTAVPELHPPNQIVYRGAFNSDVLQGDLRYTYTKSAIESDVIITHQPKIAPADCGLAPNTALLQVRHEWLVPMPPAVVERLAETGPSLVDQQLDFADLWFPSGRAFAWDGSNSLSSNAPVQIKLLGDADDDSGVPVSKEYRQTNNVGVLTESVTWGSIAPLLLDLPQMAEATSPFRKSEFGSLERIGPDSSTLAKRSFQLARASEPACGVVLDWIVVSGSGDYTFNTYVPSSFNTYWLSSGGYFGGTVTFQPGCILKYASGVNLIMYGSIVCQGTSISPSIITSQDDTLYGENITHNVPPAMSGTALWVYYNPGKITISGMNIRYANLGAEFDSNYCNSPRFFSNSALFSCNSGIKIQNVYLTIQNSIYANVPTPTIGVNSCFTFNGSLTDFSSTTDPNGLCRVAANFSGIHSARNLITDVPDTMGAVGPNHFVELLNFGIAVYDKNTGAQLSPSTSAETFFSVTVPSGQYVGSYPTVSASDPRIIYDLGSQRWIASAFDAGGSGYVLLAVSKRNNPVGSGGSTWVSDNWTKYLVPITNNGADFDTLGVDGNGIYITIRELGVNTIMLAALPKAPFLNFSAHTVQQNFILDTGVGDSTHIIYPAANFDLVGLSAPVWFIGSWNGSLYYNRLQWANGLSAPPVFSSWASLAITPSYYELPYGQGFGTLLAPQKGGAGVDPSTGSKLVMATVRQLGGTQYLWTAHTIGVNSAGNDNGSTHDRMGVEWFQIQTTPTFQIVATSRIFDPTPTNPRFYYLPSLAVNTIGDMVLGFSGSSVNDYIGAFYTRLSGGGAWMSAPIPYLPGLSAASLQSWGDYSYTSLDPDGLTIWTAQEFADGDPNGWWGTQIGAVKPFMGGL